jgi:hypothetical protein
VGRFAAVFTSRHRAGLLCALLVAAPAIAHAFCRTTTVDPKAGELCSTQGSALFWKRQCIEISVMDPGPDVASLSDTKAVVGRAFGAWLGVQCGGAPLALEIKESAEAAQCTTPQYNTHGANANSIVFISDWQKYEATASDAFGETFVFFNPDTGSIYDADTLINTSLAPLTICGDSCPPGVADMQNVLTHEAGHFFGLGHSDQKDATMYPDAPLGQVSKRTLASDDSAGICAIYGQYATPSCSSSDFTPNHGFSPKCDAPAVDTNTGASTSSSSGCSVRAPGPRRGSAAAARLRSPTRS